MKTKNEVKHTQGPWRYRGWPSKWIYVNTDSIFNSGLIATVDTHGTRDYSIDEKSAALEAEANAHLIASAPDLLAACKMLVESLNEKSPEPVIVFACIEKARAAISKAEGGK